MLLIRPGNSSRGEQPSRALLRRREKKGEQAAALPLARSLWEDCVGIAQGPLCVAFGGENKLQG